MICGLYYKNFMIVNYDRKVRSKVLTMLVIINGFIVLATGIRIVIYHCTAIMIENYDHKTFILQATEHSSNFANFILLANVLLASDLIALTCCFPDKKWLN
jgi:hypothetical protein